MRSRPRSVAHSNLRGACVRACDEPGGMQIGVARHCKDVARTPRDPNASCEGHDVSFECKWSCQFIWARERFGSLEGLLGLYQLLLVLGAQLVKVPSI